MDNLLIMDMGIIRKEKKELHLTLSFRWTQLIV